jgi:hypothetical protein
MADLIPTEGPQFFRVIKEEPNGDVHCDILQYDDEGKWMVYRITVSKFDKEFWEG